MANPGYCGGGGAVGGLGLCPPPLGCLAAAWLLLPAILLYPPGGAALAWEFDGGGRAPPEAEGLYGGGRAEASGLYAGGRTAAAPPPAPAAEEAAAFCFFDRPPPILLLPPLSEQQPDFSHVEKKGGRNYNVVRPLDQDKAFGCLSRIPWLKGCCSRGFCFCLR